MASEKIEHGYVLVQGVDMYYEVHGEGEPLVLIHGGGSTIQTSFGKILPLFALHYKVIAVELQAHGHTKDRGVPVTFQQDVDDVAALLQYLNISKANILGFSNGGHTSIEIALRHPDIVNKLVIISAFYKREGAFAGFFESMDQATLENMPQPLKTAYLHINNDQQGLQTMFERDRDRMINFKDWSDEQMRSIHAPTLIVCGDHDVVTTEHSVKMSSLIPNAQLLIVPGNHGSFIGEICSAGQEGRMPELTVGMIQEFLEK